MSFKNYDVNTTKQEVKSETGAKEKTFQYTRRTPYFE